LILYFLREFSVKQPLSDFETGRNLLILIL